MRNLKNLTHRADRTNSTCGDASGTSDNHSFCDTFLYETPFIRKHLFDNLLQQMWYLLNQINCNVHIVPFTYLKTRLKARFQLMNYNWNQNLRKLIEHNIHHVVHREAAEFPLKSVRFNPLHWGSLIQIKAEVKMN